MVGLSCGVQPPKCPTCQGPPLPLSLSVKRDSALRGETLLSGGQSVVGWVELSCDLQMPWCELVGAVSYELVDAVVFW